MPTDQLKHVMVDLETLDVCPSGVILSIGAVEFSLSGLGKELHVVVHPEQKGRSINADTVMWWMRQSPEARAAFNVENKSVLSMALCDLGQFFDRDTCIWCNGANFDEPMLVDAYKSFGYAVPWKYYNVRCYRTLKALDPHFHLPKTGLVTHNALVDATYQALTLIAVCNNKGIDLS